MHHGFGLDIFWLLNHKQAAKIINISYRLKKPDKNGFSDKCVRIRVIDCHDWWHTIKPGTPEHGTPTERRNNAGTMEHGTTERGYQGA